MPAKPPKAFDVWFMAANTVYKAVPYNVVADWTQQGRLAASDRVRPAGTKEEWIAVEDNELLADYLTRPVAAKTVQSETPPSEAKVVGSVGTPFGKVLITERSPTHAAAELPDPEPGPKTSRFEEDDEVDMIPLIDISMVLLVFFIMIQAAGALAPVDVPEMKYAGQLTADPDAITITIDKGIHPKTGEEVPVYSVRVGQQTKTEPLFNAPPEDVIKEVERQLQGATRPPEVRIACRKDLPRERVYELRRMLEPMRKKNMINSTVATVVEAPEQK